MMNKHERALLIGIRHLFETTVDAEQLIAPLLKTEVLTAQDVADITKLRSSQERAGRLLDLLVLAGGLDKRGDRVFSSFCAALEDRYPQVLKAMKQQDNESNTSSRPELLSLNSESSSRPFYPTSPYPRFTPPPPPVPISPMTTIVPRVPSLPQSRPPIDNRSDHDWTKMQLDLHRAELRETTKKLDQTRREADMYHQMYELVKDKAEKANIEIKDLKKKESDIRSSRTRLEQEVNVMHVQLEEQRQENEELRQQQREVLSESGSSEVLNKVLNTTVDKFSATKQELEDLRKKYADLFSDYATRTSNHSQLQLDYDELQRRDKETVKDLNMTKLQHTDLQKQLDSAIQQWNKALRDKNDIEQELHRAKKSLEDLHKQIAIAGAEQKKRESQLQHDRDQLIGEYHLIMSERQVVHKEIEQLQEQLSKSDNQVKQLLEEKKTSNHALKMAEAERDEAMKSVSELCMQNQHRSHLSEEFTSSLSSEKESSELIRGSERDSGRSAISIDRRSHLEAYDKLSKSSLDSVHTKEVEVFRKEMESYKKEIDRLKSELNEMSKESEQCKKNQDWAIGEREKIIMERDSMRTLCDKLRHDRDRAVSDHAEALRDMDELKKQKNEVDKEVNDLKEKVQKMSDKEARKNQLHSVEHNYSKDSAIDADIQDWDMEKVEVILDGISSSDLGFDVVSGNDADGAIFINSVTKGSIAHGRLRVNDQILKVNNVDMANVDKSLCMQLARTGGPSVHMVVKRKKMTSRVNIAVPLNLIGSRGESGLSLESGSFIRHIIPGSAAARDGSLSVGDRVQYINGQPVDNRTTNEIERMLESSLDSLVLTVVKYVNSMSGPSQNGNVCNDPLLSTASPKSPWTPISFSSSPDSGKATMDSISSHQLKSSGSQTDSLDSPPGSSQVYNNTLPHATSTPVHRTLQDVDKPAKGFTHVIKNIVRNPFDKKRDSSRDRVRDTSHERVHEKEIMIVDDVRRVTSHPPPSKNRNSSEEEEALGELDAVLNTYSKTGSGGSGGKGKPKRRRERPNGGTWPKCHDMVDLSVFPNQISERPPLKNIIDEHTYARAPAQLPPEPPSRSDSFKRNDSFKRSGSVKHSPQSSDSQSTIKYIHSKVSANSSPASQSGVFMPSSSPQQQQLVNHQVDTKPKQHESLHSQTLSYTSQAIPQANVPPQMVYVKSGNSDSNALSTDNSIVSVKPHTPEFQRIINRTRHRPTSAPGRTRREHREIANIVLNQDSQPPQKPTYLNITPAFSPRPIPSSKQNIVPYHHSTEMMPSGNSSNTQSNSFAPHQTSRSLMTRSMGAEYSGFRMDASVPEIQGYNRMYANNQTYSSSPSPSPSQPSSTTGESSHGGLSSSQEFPYNRVRNTHHNGSNWPRSGAAIYGDGSSTLPAGRRHANGQHYSERIRIPSNPSMMSINSSSDRSSPISPFRPIALYQSSSQSLPKNVITPRARRPNKGETRRIKIEMNQQPLGIRIEKGASSSGIFVSSVTSKSLASREGITVGDQLLEVCGINLRMASLEEAQRVLASCRGDVELLVQFNPKKYTDEEDSSTEPSSSETSPANTPRVGRTHTGASHLVNSDISTTISPNSSAPQSPLSDDVYQTRFVFLKKTNPHDDLGFKLAGGNAVGIFVRYVEPNSIAAGSKGLVYGDQILEFNGVNLRSATAEQAAIEVSRARESATILTETNVQRMESILNVPWDSIYLKALFDREAEKDGELSFRKDSILYIDDTLHNGVLGQWQAWLISEDGNKLHAGTIPSKTVLEEELAQRKSMSDIHDEDSLKSGRRGSGANRRSFFRRRKHQRNNSKDSRELSSNFYSEMSINSDSLQLDEGALATFQRVEKIDCMMTRPVIIVGPLAEPIINKLTSESPDKYCRCEPEKLPFTSRDNGMLVDFKQKDDHYEIITFEAVRKIIQKRRHCMMNISPSAIEDLRKSQIYPIVIFIKHKSAKQIRKLCGEVRDTRFYPEKMTSKHAKELFDTFTKYEIDYRHLFSDTISGGNLAFMSVKIKSSIEKEQKKPLWIPSGSL